MAKLLWFVGLLVALGSVFFLRDFKNLEVSNEKFETVVKREMEAEKARLAKIAAMEAAKKAAAEKKDEPLVVLDTPELENGHNVYFKKGKCITCHGNKGQGKKSQQAPKLAAQHDWYIYSTLVKVKNDERVIEKMKPYLNNLSDQDFKDVSLFLSKIPPQ